MLYSGGSAGRQSAEFRTDLRYAIAGVGSSWLTPRSRSDYFRTAPATRGLAECLEQGPVLI